MWHHSSDVEKLTGQEAGAAYGLTSSDLATLDYEVVHSGIGSGHKSGTRLYRRADVQRIASNKHGTVSNRSGAEGTFARTAQQLQGEAGPGNTGQSADVSVDMSGWYST